MLTAGNRSVSAEKRCGSGVSTPFTPMVSTYRKGMTNFPPFFNFFFLLFSFPTEIFYIYFTCIFTFVLIITSSSINSWYLYSHLISFVWSQDQHLTLLFLSSSSVFISHLTNFLSYSVFMFVACLFLCHFAFEKEPARFET